MSSSPSPCKLTTNVKENFTDKTKIMSYTYYVPLNSLRIFKLFQRYVLVLLLFLMLFQNFLNFLPPLLVGMGVHVRDLPIKYVCMAVFQEPRQFASSLSSVVTDGG